MEKERKVTILLIILVLVIAGGILYWKNSTPPSGDINEELAKCIGEKSTLYVQTGCVHCKTQEKMFGEYLSNIKIVNCADDIQKCVQLGIKKTPTWIINNQLYEGVYDISDLKEMTRC